jgi:hypothetical protein
MKVLNIGKTLAVAAMVGASLVTVDFGQKAQALTFVESGDAGQTLATAQTVGEGVTVIQGATNFANNDFVDLFRFNWGGGIFDATTLGSAIDDPILALFDTAGTVLAQNDDFYGLQSRLLVNNLVQGDYLLGLSGFSNFASNGPSYGSFGSTGSYSITLNQPTTAIPTPALLPSLVGMGIAVLRKRKSEASVEVSEA